MNASHLSLPLDRLISVNEKFFLIVVMAANFLVFNFPDMMNFSIFTVCVDGRPGWPSKNSTQLRAGGPEFEARRTKHRHVRSLGRGKTFLTLLFLERTPQNTQN